MVGKHFASSPRVTVCVPRQPPVHPSTLNSKCGEGGISLWSLSCEPSHRRRLLSVHSEGQEALSRYEQGRCRFGVTSIKLAHGARGGVQTGTWAPGPPFWHLTAMRPQASHLTPLPCRLLICGARTLMPSPAQRQVGREWGGATMQAESCMQLLLWLLLTFPRSLERDSL